MHKIATAALLAIGLLAGVPGGGPASATTSNIVTTSTRVTVAYVVDGDTARLADGRYVRLIGYDTPERGQRYFGAATRSLERFIPASGRVRLVNPSSVDNRDRYGRLLRYVRIDTRDAGKRLIRQGYGHARYDSRDGYDWHPLQRRYHRIDNNTPDLWRL